MSGSGGASGTGNLNRLGGPGGPGDGVATDAPGASGRVVPALRRAHVDLGAIRENVAHVVAGVAPAQVLAVVKAGGYGHGAVEVARAALEGGASGLGVADVDEALALRAAGITAPVLAWLHRADPQFDAAVASDIALGLSTRLQLQRAVEAGSIDTPAVVQLKLDTGLGRNGAERGEWQPLLEAVRDAVATGRIRFDGLFSHLSNASDADDRAQLAAFDEATALAHRVGLKPGLRHLASTAGTMALPETRLDQVRLGIGLYGLSPYDDVSSAELGLRPALRLESRLISVKHVPAGTGVSYGYTYHPGADTWLGLVPLGYADGIPRHVSNRGSVWVNGAQHRIVGRVAMDQFVVDLGSARAEVGDRVVLFGDPAEGFPSADDWAEAGSTINYEIVTRLGRRIERVYE